ncbi:HAD family hydrolase [Halomarina halobia]|uniref:HAD family hydrolase n=1 Tax=Halomarina halobia TaxID=3033386 RepID=A0ABD6AC32_9EURY|nr:HAD family hydrolase [Halomarina sp. PSR21]
MTTTRTPTTVLFDLDNTLCEHATTFSDRLAAAFERVGVDPFFGTADVHRWLPRVSAESALDLREQVFGGIARELGRDPSVADDLAAAYVDPDPADVRPLPGAREAVDALGEEYHLGLVTNGGRAVQRAKLDALDLGDAFDASVYAGGAMPVKPDAEPFERALSALSAAPGEALHVGDSLGSDVAGANALGLRSVWVPHAESLREGPTPSHTIDTLYDLPGLL